MTDAFKCDRCGDYFDDEPEILKHPSGKKDAYYEKELCWNCYYGWIEYVTGVPANEINNWDGFKSPNAAESDDVETVWVVAANYADDPHPHVEAVFSNEDSAEALSDTFEDPTAGLGPIAWGFEEKEVKDG